ncbi:MAG: Hpt domain-containing protein [Bacteroidales bacterium]|nr:Hpt domain-containing protein [Bacteroidales bacterium]
MVVNTRKLDSLLEEFGEKSFLEIYNIFLEEVSEVVEGMRNSILTNNLSAFQNWAHRGKTTAGTFGIMRLSKELDYYAHCELEKINIDIANKVVDKCEKDFILAIDEINDYIRTIKQKS